MKGGKVVVNVFLGVSILYIVAATVGTREGFGEYKRLSKDRDENAKVIKQLESALGYS